MDNKNTADRVAPIYTQQLPSNNSLNMRLGKCEVCASNNARYSCPKCEVKTCCLACVRIHKKELDCNGLRDRTKFISMQNMTKMDFMNDYYFLEECTRYVDDRKTDRIKRYTNGDRVLPPHLFKLQRAATDRNTTLRFLLRNFSRRKENTTYYDFKKCRILWRVEWVFTNAECLKFVDERCAEDTPLSLLLDKYINPENLTETSRKKPLEYYQSMGLNELQVFLKAEGIKGSSMRFHALDVSKTLRENLAGKTIIEFPTIHVSYNLHYDNDVVIRNGENINDIQPENPDKVQTNERMSVCGDDNKTSLKFEAVCDSNYLFTNEDLWNHLSSSSDEEDTNSCNENSFSNQ